MRTYLLSHHFRSMSFTKISQRKQYNNIHVLKNKHTTPHKLKVINRQTNLCKRFCESRKYSDTDHNLLYCVSHWSFCWRSRFTTAKM